MKLTEERIRQIDVMSRDERLRLPIAERIAYDWHFKQNPMPLDRRKRLLDEIGRRIRNGTDVVIG